MYSNKQGDANTLPEREEQDSLDAKEFGYEAVSTVLTADSIRLTDRPERLDVGSNTNPEHRKAAIIVSANLTSSSQHFKGDTH